MGKVVIRFAILR